GDFTGKVRRELQTNITQNQPKMLVLNKQVMLSVDTPLDRPEIRRVSFFTDSNNIFYLELAIDRTEFIKLHDFDSSEVVDADALLDSEQADQAKGTPAAATAPAGGDESDELLRSLGM
ncbi:MAG: DUF3334 family protein, partial [Burkholderiaceae bacterium]|nr:DUF3334 family protein [Burkholderiaceae bacterium]